MPHKTRYYLNLKAFLNYKNFYNENEIEKKGFTRKIWLC